MLRCSTYIHVTQNQYLSPNLTCLDYSQLSAAFLNHNEMNHLHACVGVHSYIFMTHQHRELIFMYTLSTLGYRLLNIQSSTRVRQGGLLLLFLTFLFSSLSAALMHFSISGHPPQRGPPSRSSKPPGLAVLPVLCHGGTGFHANTCIHHPCLLQVGSKTQNKKAVKFLDLMATLFAAPLPIS